MDMDYFNAEKMRDNLVSWLRDWFEKNGPDCKAVIGISGGKDSTIVAAACARAIGKERVLGVLMPNGVQKDIGDSIAVCNSLGIKYVVVNINKAYNAISSEVDVNLAEKLNWTEGLSNQTSVNLAPRLRMATLYAISQTVKGRVINTSNKSEYMTGYFTRWGDECGDCKPLINLLKSEVVAIGLTMPEIPRYLVEKTPSDGLSGQSDEDRLGFTYDQLDTYFKGGRVSEDIAKKIESKVFGTLFKRNPPEAFQPWPMA